MLKLLKTRYSGFANDFSISHGVYTDVTSPLAKIYLRLTEAKLLTDLSPYINEYTRHQKRAQQLLCRNSP